MRENTILTKLGLPTIRKAGHFEQTIDQYGVKGRWVIDAGEFQARRAFPSIAAAFAAALAGIEEWPAQRFAVLTAKEQDIVNQAMRG